MSAGTRSRAITATAPAPSAMRACSGVTTSMITPPLSISAMPRLTRAVPVCAGPPEPLRSEAVAPFSTVGPFPCYGSSVKGTFKLNNPQLADRM